MRILFLFTLLYIIAIGCSTSDGKTTIEPGDYNYEWAVPEGSIVGKFKPFPLVKNPAMTKARDIDFISDNSVVFLVGIDDEIRVYPYKYISPYECINDVINDTNYMLTLCPITQSALCFNSVFKDEKLTFRASGYLLYDNIVAYDAKTDNYWAQMWAKSIKGKYVDEYLTTINYIETDWKMVRDYFPEALVYSDSIGANKDQSILAKRLRNKSDGFDENELPFGVIQPSAKGSPRVHIFNFKNFPGELSMIQKYTGSKNTIIIGSTTHNFITAYYVDNTSEYALIEHDFPNILEDNKGNTYNIFGRVVAGPELGLQLKSPTSFRALGWAWEAFYSDFVTNH